MRLLSAASDHHASSVKAWQRCQGLGQIFNSGRATSLISFIFSGVIILTMTIKVYANSEASFDNLLRIQRAKLDEFDAYAKSFLLPQDFDLAEQMPVNRPSPSEIDAMQNEALFEGDILGFAKSMIEEEPMESTLNSDATGDEKIDETAIFSQPYHSSLNSATYPDKLWKHGRVPYVLEEGMTDSQRAAIAQAFDEYKQKTCIRFVPKEKTDIDYIYVKRNVAYGCSSYVGRAGGNQTVSLEIGKCFSKGIIAHELMHSIGFFHEHSRTDRDEFVRINESNVRIGMLRNFEKYPRKIIDSLTMPYDYDSVMHYHKLAFSKNGKPTIQPIDSTAEIGQRYKLSVIDSMKVNKLYQCDKSSKSTTTTTETSSNERTHSKTTEESMTTATAVKELITTTKEVVDSGNRQEMRRRGYTTTVSTPIASTAFSITNILLPAISLPRELYHIIIGNNDRKNKPLEKIVTSASSKSSEDEEDEEELAKNRQPSTPKNMEKTVGLITLSIFSSRATTQAPYKRHRPASVELTTTTTRRNVDDENKFSGKGCMDLNSHCEMWQRLGHCDHSSKYMRHYCRKSCGLCDERKTKHNSAESVKEDRNVRIPRACLDRNVFCGYWARIGECRSESKFMKIFCKRSCGNCES